MKKIKYKYTKILLIIGFVLSLILCFKSFTLIGYMGLVILFTFIFGSIGWTIDRFRPKKIITLLLVLFYLMNGGFYIYHEMNQMHCMGLRLTIYKNIFTGECRQIGVGCGIEAPWYWKKDAVCTETILRQNCNLLSKEELLYYNNSCDIYIQMHGTYV